MNRRWIAALAAGTLLAGSVAAAATADLTTPPSDVGDVAGLAWDPDGERLWFAGDDASEGKLVGVTEDGEESEITFGGSVRSVQALSIVDGILYVGDIGDARGNRNSLRVIRMRDAEPGQKQYWAYDMRYPDGSHDARAMMVSPDGQMFFVTTGDEPGIYSAPEEPSREQTNELTREADAPEGVTDAVFVDDETVVLHAADGLHVVDVRTWETRSVEPHPDGTEDGALAVRDGELLVATADEVRTVAVPDGPADGGDESPKPGEEQSEDPTGEPGGEQSESPSEDDGEGAGNGDQAAQNPPPPTNVPRNTGTFIALALAGLAALVAGVVTYFVRA